MTKFHRRTADDAAGLHSVMLIYNLLGHSSIYSGRTSSLWFYSKDESINFNGDIAGGNNFKCLSYKVLTNIVADGDHWTQ